MSAFEIIMIFFVIILIIVAFQVVKYLKSISLQLTLLQKTVMNFEKIVFDDNFEIKAELRHINSKDVYDKDFLKNVRNLTITRE